MTANMNRPELCNAIVATEQQKQQLPQPTSVMDHGYQQRTHVVEHPEDRPFSSLPFPWKVHELLEDAEAEGYTDIVSWMPGFAAFRVHKQKLFVKHIMPRYFKQTKYRSFRRQLNLWGFERLDAGPNRGGYWNPNFVHKRPSLCHNMKRTEVKQKMSASDTRHHQQNHQQKSGLLSTSTFSRAYSSEGSLGCRPENPVSRYFKTSASSLPSFPTLPIRKRTVSEPSNISRMPTSLTQVHQSLNVSDLFDEETLALVLPPSLYDDREVYPTTSSASSSKLRSPHSSSPERIQPGFLKAAEAR